MSAAEMVRRARELVARGDGSRAAQLLSRARATDLDVAPELARVLAGFRVRNWSDRLAEDLLACFAHPGVDPQMLAGIAASLLLVGPEQHPLWAAYLTRCINTDAALETRIAAMRAVVLAGWVATGEIDALAEALAVQGFANEYAVPWAEDPPADAPSEIAAMYGMPAGENLPPALAHIAAELAEERALAAAMPSLGEETDASAAVRAQYEANPYPRWRAPPPSPEVDLRAIVGRLPGVDASVLPEAPWRVLVAGCGTGFEAIDLARMDAALAVTALDLSRASLAYGARMARALNIANIRFVQGDLLRLSTGEEARWDLVTATGVLHHLADPAAGLAALRDVLAPGGLMRIALYSRRARALVTAAHAVIRERGFGSDAEGIRAFRAHVLALPDDAALAGLRHSEDFYSVSGCRDLCFHVQEHVYALPEVRALATGARLRIVGFDAPPEAMARYRAAGGNDPLDLDAWDQLESAHPETFAGMYHLWCQRPA